jgi:hypothetical protein
LGGGCRAAIAAEALYPISRDGGDHTIRDLPDAIAIGVGDVEIAGGIYGYAGGGD